MNFEQALAAMRSGSTVRRPRWGSIQNRYSVKLDETGGTIVQVSATGNAVWEPKQADILATDWSIAA